MSRYYKATEVDEFLNIFGKGNCNLCAFYDECNPVGLDGEGSNQYCWQARQFPTADVTEVVRCKDCKYFLDKQREYHQGICMCEEKDTSYAAEFYPYADDFCSYGERKDEE